MEVGQTLEGRIDGVGIQGRVLGGGKAQEEGDKEESKGEHVDLVALFLILQLNWIELKLMEMSRGELYD